MSEAIIEIRGEPYVRLTTVAECYELEVTWLEEVYALGLLGDGERYRRTIAIRARLLARVARIVQLHFHQGVNLEGVALLLGDEED